MPATGNEPKVTHQHPRPSCPTCSREMIHAAIQVGEIIISAWLCDCMPQPAGFTADILRAREWDDQSLIYIIEAVHEDT